MGAVKYKERKKERREMFYKFIMTQREKLLV
jgi:hypothetical protein